MSAALICPMVIDRRYKKFKARKSSRSSSKLQLPNEVTNFRSAFIETPFANSIAAAIDQGSDIRLLFCAKGQ